jgi:hypothetical protein
MAWVEGWMRNAKRSYWRSLAWPFSAVLTIAAATTLPNAAIADEGGLSFWLPGLYGSLSSVPGVPGWSYSAIYYHSDISAGGNKTFPQGGEIRAGLAGRADIVAYGPTYIFEEPVLGGQAAFSLLGIVGNTEASVDATLTGPGGKTVSGHLSQSLFSYGDVLPQATLKWNEGVNNFMLYATGDIPVGDYDEHRLANAGLGHGAIDGGVGYTYFDPKTGHEFSVAAGLTYNLENEHTHYQNGIDAHIDWGASQFLSEQVHVGLVGYYYQQLTGDSGEGATLGDFISSVAGIGPQIGYIFPAGDMQGYVNLKGYYEFEAENRPQGWNVWVTLAFSPKAPPAAPMK